MCFLWANKHFGTHPFSVKLAQWMAGRTKAEPQNVIRVSWNGFPNRRFYVGRAWITPLSFCTDNLDCKTLRCQFCRVWYQSSARHWRCWCLSRTWDGTSFIVLSCWTRIVIRFISRWIIVLCGRIWLI